MKKLFYWTLFVFVSIAFNSCSLFGGGGKSNDPNFQISDLQGLWEENHTQHYVRFTADRAEEYPYFLPERSSISLMMGWKMSVS